MCDTILAMPDSTAERGMLFGKNSDRQRNEAQAVEYFQSVDYPRDAQLKCTYLTIPEAQHTHAVLLCRPFWIWGAEMGANERGVVIGNEGLRARGPAPEKGALIGMDLLRLALERASSADEAVFVITQLLEQYGQGGNCGYVIPHYYHNGFLVADPEDAYVLETVGREWLVERVRGVRAISNDYSITHHALRTSKGLPELVREYGGSGSSALTYAEALADPHYRHIGSARQRYACSTALMCAHRGSLTAADLMRILRDHGSGDRHRLEWQDECTLTPTICMHAGAEDRFSQTVGSLVSELCDTEHVHWVTGTSAPCLSIFKPVLLDVPLPTHGARPTDRFDERTLWWQHERLHRAALLGDFARFLEDIREERDGLEAHFRTQIKAVLNGGSAGERAQTVSECWRKAIEVEGRWRGKLLPRSGSLDPRYRDAWIAMNQAAGLDT